MTTHTPGPWTVYDDAILSPIPEMAVGTVFPCDPHGSGYRYGEVTAANARLIAAAPELLEALVAAVDCGMVPISSAREGGATSLSRQIRVADQIRDAIAKATGAQP